MEQLTENAAPISEMGTASDVLVGLGSIKDSENLSEIQHLPPNTEGRFARVADKYFELVTTPDGSQIWKYREKAELKSDSVNLNQIPKYHGFTVEHNFINYRDSINGWLNLSQAMRWRPIEGTFSTIEKLFTHIFGEQLQLGYDRYSLLVRNPHQLQPILVVTSREQSTGKTTLLYLDSLLFGANAVILNVSQYSQQFNGLFASKLTIGIDETVISEAFIKERLKQDSTAKTIQLRKMHQEHEAIPFFGKFTLCTNKETDFAKLEEEDLRFWVRKVSKITDYDPEFEDKIQAEIPHFLHFLLNRELSVPKRISRQWFSPEQLKTDALQAVRENSRSDIAKDILEFVMDKIATATAFGATSTELWELMGRRYSISALTKALKEELKLDNKNKRYIDSFGASKVGRAYLFGESVAEPKEDDDSSLPF